MQLYKSHAHRTLFIGHLLKRKKSLAGSARSTVHTPRYRFMSCFDVHTTLLLSSTSLVALQFKTRHEHTHTTHATQDFKKKRSCPSLPSSGPQTCLACACEYRRLGPSLAQPSLVALMTHHTRLLCSPPSPCA